jgi:hypothetical protein
MFSRTVIRKRENSSGSGLREVQRDVKFWLKDFPGKYLFRSGEMASRKGAKTQRVGQDWNQEWGKLVIWLFFPFLRM